LFFYVINEELEEMGRRKRRAKKKRIKKPVSPQLTLDLDVKGKEELGITGKFRLIKTFYGTILLVQHTNGKFKQPNVDHIKYLVSQKLISPDIGSSVPLK
jgi:hypothetical protein